MRRAISILGGVGLGLMLSQFPEYAQQYQQRLGGAVDELRVIVTDFDATAAREGLNRKQALIRYQENTDNFIVGRGADMAATIVRYERLSGHLGTLEDTGPLQRLSGFTRFYDEEIGTQALNAYIPAMPVSVEGLAYAGVGVLSGYGAVSLILGLLGAPFRRRAR